MCITFLCNSKLFLCISILRIYSKPTSHFETQTIVSPSLLYIFRQTPLGHRGTSVSTSSISPQLIFTQIHTADLHVYPQFVFSRLGLTSVRQTSSARSPSASSAHKAHLSTNRHANKAFINTSLRSRKAFCPYSFVALIDFPVAWCVMSVCPASAICESMRYTHTRSCNMMCVWTSCSKVYWCWCFRSRLHIKLLHIYCGHIWGLSRLREFVCWWLFNIAKHEAMRSAST